MSGAFHCALGRQAANTSSCKTAKCWCSGSLTQKFNLVWCKLIIHHKKSPLAASCATSSRQWQISELFTVSSSWPNQMQTFAQVLRNSVNSFTQIIEVDMSRAASRITSTVACDMDLTKYPMDEQECRLDLESCKFHLWGWFLDFLPCYVVNTWPCIRRRLLFRGHRVSLVGEPATHPRAGQTGALPVHHHRLSIWHWNDELQIWWAAMLFCFPCCCLECEQGTE